MNKNTLLLCSFVALILMTGCFRNPATRKVHTRLLSNEAERRIGEETKNKLLEQYRILESTTVTSYVNEIGQKLAKVCDRPTVDYEFIVLDHDLINAFAAPGGFIFVTRGLLENISDEGELAMVLGHEIAHVAALHGVQMIQKEMGQNALTVLGTIGAALVSGPEAMIMINKTGTLFSALYLLGYSREKELEADNLGLQYLLRADYSPHASLRFLEELEHGDEKDLKGWDLYFRTHPMTSERIDIIEHMIGKDEKEKRENSRIVYQKIKAHLPKVDHQKGSIAGHHFSHDGHEVSLNVPDNWHLGFLHPQSLVSFFTTDQKGQGRLQVVDTSTKTETAEQLAYQFAKFNGFQFVNGRQVLYKAGYGYLGRFRGVSPRGHLMEYRIFVTIRRKKGFLLLCGAPPEKIESYILDMEKIMRGLEFS